MPKSGSLSPQVFSALLVLATVLHALALIFTTFRLWFRHHIRRLWWDDFWAAFALLGEAISMAATWMNATPMSKSNAGFGSFPIHPQSRTVHIVAFWLGIISYTCTIWFSRISIVLSLARIVPPNRWATKITIGAGTLFICMWAYVSICKMVVCSLNEAWYEAPWVQCPIPNWVALSEVCTDVSSDVILVILPLRFLWHVKLPSNQKIMLLSVFSTSILVTVVSVVHTVYIMSNAAIIGAATAEIESAVSVIVCNLLVIVTFIYRVITNGEDLTRAFPFKDDHPNSNRLTTVDLDVSGGSLFTSVITTTGSSGTAVGAKLAGTRPVSGVNRSTTPI